MNKYVFIQMVWFDCYERVALIGLLESENKYFVGFVEYSEYLESNEISTKRKPGEILYGEIKIILVDIIAEVDVSEKLFFSQNICNSPHVTAIVQVEEIIDNFTVKVKISNFFYTVQLEFETPMYLSVGTKIKITGELMLDFVDNN